MSQSPQVWKTLSIEEIGLPRTPKIDPARYPEEIFELYSVPSFALDRPEIVQGRSIGSIKQAVEPGDVLLCKIIPHLVRVWCVPSKGRHRQIASGEWIVIRPTSEIVSTDYLRYALIQPEFRQLFMETVSGVGGSLMRARPQVVSHIKIPIPPKNEQRRIVAKLNALFSSSTNSRQELAKIPRLVDRYSNAVISTALRGNFTNEWREKRGISVESWKPSSMADLCQPDRTITYGVIKLGSEDRDGIPCLRTSNVRWLDIDTEGMKRISPALSDKYARTILQGGEILVNVRGTLGGVAVASPEMKGWNVSREIAVVPVDVRIADPSFVAYWVASKESQRWLTGVQRGVAYTGINLTDLRQLEVRLPSLEEQKQIVFHIRRGLKAVTSVAREAERAQILLDRLDEAVLSKAFRGELMSHSADEDPCEISIGEAATRKGNVPEFKVGDKVQRRASMQRVTLESARETISSMPADRFSFDDLRAHLAADYETLREIVFGLLDEPSPVISQVFDSQTKSIVFSRSQK